MNGLLRRFYAVKRKGVSAYATFMFIVGLVFTGRDLCGLLKTEPERAGFKKDVVYRFLNDPGIHWEQILSHTAYAVIPELKKKGAAAPVAANVIDDSPYYRDRSKKVEMLSVFYDHAEKRYYKGFDLLCLGWTDGETFAPVKAQVVAAGEESGLLEPSRAKKDKRTLATRRRADARKDKNALALQMLAAIKGTPAQARHVAFDSWFQSPLSVVEIKNLGYDVVARAKNNENYRYLYKGEKRSISGIYKMNKKRRGKSRYLLSVDILVAHEGFEEAVAAKLVFVRDKNNRKKWIALICTDTSLTEDQIIELYGLRWSIEPFFKVLKSYLRLETGYQGRSFDAVTAHASIVMIRYIILALRKREGAADSAADAFFSLCHELDAASFKNLFEGISGAVKQALHDFLHVSGSMAEGFLAYFMSILPDNVKKKLGGAPA
jgi:hypothetical protein